MHRLSTSAGWALAGNHLLWSDTEGRSWAEITPPLQPGESIDEAYFLDTAKGWLLAHRVVGLDRPDISIVSTADGGKTWAAVPIAANNDFLLQGYGNAGYLVNCQSHP